MPMNTYRDNAEFLHLFSKDQDGLKYLTHDFSDGIDFIEYVYRCQQRILSCRSEMELNSGLYDLVRGFVFGPEWTDYDGKQHSFFVSSEDCASYYDSTGRHPLNNPAFESDFEAFRNSIRFRSGRLDLFLREELAGEFPQLELVIPNRLKGADMYVMTGPVRSAIRLILKSMLEYSDTPKVVFSFSEEEVADGLLKSTLSINQVGSFPSHTLSRDMNRLAEEEGGTFGTIRKLLRGLCEWSVVSRWQGSSEPQRWRILREETLPELSPASIAEGFTHEIHIYHRP